MKKLLYASLFVVGVALPSIASVSVNFVCSGTLKLGASDLPVGALVQLVWSQDTSFATPIGGQIPGVGGQYAGGDVVLFRDYTTVAGYWDAGAPRQDLDSSAKYTTALNLPSGYPDINSGYLYALVFANGTPVAGDKYLVSGLVGSGGAASLPDADNPLNQIPKLDVTPLGSTQTLSMTVAVPEPSTVGLLLLGVGVIAVRRFRKN